MRILKPHTFYSPHAADRFKERYGHSTSDIDWVKAFLDVVDGRSVLLACNNGRERRIVRVAGIACIVIYDPDRARFITTLPQFFRPPKFWGVRKMREMPMLEG